MPDTTTCDKCGAEVLVVRRARMHRQTWVVEEPQGCKVIKEAEDEGQAPELEFYDAPVILHPAPHVDGRWYFLEPDQVMYVPLNEEHNLANPSDRYVPHSYVCLKGDDNG